MLFEFGGLFRKVWRVALVLGTFVIGASTLFVAPVSAATGINQQLNFQGRLLNAQGAIVPDGYYNVEFKIYQDGTGTAAGNPGGTLKWSEDWLNSGGHPVRVLNGYMSVQLGSINAFGNSIDWNQDTIWLSINIGNTSSCTITTDFTTDCGGDGEMLPMKRMSAVPYALNAVRLGGLTAAGFIQNTTTVQTATNMAIDGTARADTSILTPLVDTNTATALNIGTTNATAINLNQNVTVAANKTLTLAGGTTASRPASPAEGTLWYDTTTKQLLIYANGKWQSDRSTSTKIVAASNASQALKDSADYVATGTSDQTVINTALTAAAGGKVYLTEGTFTISGSISVPNNTTLSGAGTGTVITIPNAHNTSINAVTNTTTGGNGTGVVIQDLKLDGNKTNQTSGTMHGLYINGAGSGSTVLGVTASRVTSTNWLNNGFTIVSSANSKFENSSASGDAYGFYTSAVTSSAFTGNVSSGNDIRGYSFNSSSYLTLTGNIAQNGSGSGFSLNAVTYSALSGNVSQSNSYGFVIGASSDHNTLTGNTAATNGVYGIYLNSTTNNTVSGNTVYNSGDSGTNNGIYVAGSSNNTIASNSITDTSYTSNNYAINISDAGSSSNYLADNTLGTGSINDQGTGTIYGGQYKSTTAYLIQPAADVTIAAPSSTTNLLSSSIYLGYTGATNLIGNGTAGLNLLTSNQTASGTGALWLGSGNSSASSATSGVVTLSSGTVSGTSSTSGGVTIQSGANAGTGASGNVGIWTGNAASGTSGNISIDTGVGSVSNGYINIGTTNASNIYLGKSGTTTTVQGALQLNDNVTVAANKTLTLAGGTTASRPASPTEGMLWYDTDTKQLLVYANGKWQADRSTSTKIVAASNASQALKDSADYVATGTGDQTVINNALTAAAGGKVYLTEGTFTINGSISVPNNTTLTGAGAGTVITIPNSFNTNINAIVATDVTTGTGITISDLRIDGNKTNNTSGTQNGIYFNNMGGGSGSSARQGTKITNSWITSFRNAAIMLENSSNSIISNNHTNNNYYGLYMYVDNYMTVEGNIIQGNTRGVNASATNRSTFTGNIVESNSGEGILIFASSYSNTVSANNFNNNSTSGISLDNTSDNEVSGNKFRNNGTSTANEAIVLATTATNNTIVGNSITDSAATTNFAIDINSINANSNYLADNTLGGGSINDQGTGTIYGGQANTAGDFVIQPASTIKLQKDTSISGAITGTSSLTLGTSSSTNGTLVFKNSSNANTLTLLSAAQTHGNYTLSLPDLTADAEVCTSLNNCGASLNTNDFIQNQNSTDQSANFRINGTGQAVNFVGTTSITTPLIDTISATALNIGTTNATSISLNQNVTVAAGKSLTLAGGNTASRPASPTEGMLWYDTSTHEMLKWNGTKWISNGSDAYLVAASNSSQADKDAADYVATGSSDQTTIQSALDRADPASVVSGARKSGKVYLFAGTYTTNDVISIPNNTTLAGAGRGSLIKFANINGQTKNMITNSDTSTGTGVTVRDLQLDGNNSVNTSGTMRGIYFNGMGGSSGASARQGANIISSWVNNFYTDGVYLASSPNSTIIGNNVQGNTGNGIYISSSNRSNITNNVSQGNGGSGIVLTGAISENVVANTFAVNATAGVYLNGTSNNNFIGSNSLFNNGGNATNNAIYFPASANADYNTFTSNSINDTSGTTSNYAINISDNTSNYNYFADNVFTSTAGTSTINDPSGTNSVFSNQPFAENGGKITNRTANDAAAFTFQKADGTNILTVDTTNSKVLVSGTIDTATAATLNIGTATANAISIGSSGITTTIAGNTGVTLNATTGTTMVCRNTTGLLSTCDATYVAPTATNFIQNQNASQQTGNFRISGTGQADTSILTPLVDTATAVALNIGTTNATSVTLGKSAISTTLSSSTINVGTSGSTTSILGAAQTTSGQAGNNMVIQGSNGLNGNGGTVTIQGGNANGTGTLGGNLTLAGGTGSTSNGLVILGTSAFQTVTNDTGCFVGGTEVATSCTISSTAINNNASVLVGFSADGLIATMPDPSITTAGRVVYVTASGATKDFTLRANTGEGTGIEQNIAMRKNTTATMIWNGGNWTAAGASSSTTLQAAYDNTLQSAGGAELVVSKTTATNGLTIRDATGANAVNGTLLSIQTSSAANLLTVNSNVTEYTSNSGAETYSGTTTTFPASTWTALTGATVTRNTSTANIATGQGSAQVVTSTTAGSGVKNVLNTSLTPSQHYNVSFSAKLSSGTFTDMAVYYSVDGSADSVTCTTGQAINTSVWTKVNCTFTAPSSGITSSNSINIRQAGSGTAHTFYVDNISVTIAADYNYATDPGADDTVNFSTNWTAAGTATVTQNLSDGNDASSSAQASTSTANSGVRNKLSINPLTSTLYRVSVYAKLSSGTALSDFHIRYTPNGGTNYVDCVDYNKQTVTSSWTQITCYINTSTTTVSSPYVYFLQTTASGTRVILVDTFSMTLASNATPNVQIGSGSNGGPTTLFTLDKGASAPIAANNDALLGSMYYDTTLGKLQCYEADGWGACGSSPDNIVTISPEYTNAVMHGTGVGTMVSDFCSDTLNINDPTNAPAICGANETYNFYKWTSPQPTPQTYSIYVTYQLPTTFKSFASGQTSLMGKTDSGSSSVTYQIYRNNSSTGLTPCGSNVSVSTGVQSAWITQVASGAADPSTCSFTPGDSIVFKISVTASNNANAYVGNLGFTYSNK